MIYEKMYSTIDTHVAGEAFRIVIQSPIRLSGADIQESHEELKNNFSNEKNLLLNEPRGHRGMHGCVVVPSRNADFSLLFFNHDGVSNFKYEGLLATVTALLETGNLNHATDGRYAVETVTGIYTVKALIENQEVSAISVENRSCSMIGTYSDYMLVRVDDARNYVLCKLPESIPCIGLEQLSELNRWGLEKTVALAGEGIEYAGVVVIESDSFETDKYRSVTFERDGYILRSPGIDSTFAILAMLHEQGKGPTEIENHSIFGSSLIARKSSEEGDRFSIETGAFVTGSSEFIVDQDDPLKEGFLLV